MSHSFNSNTKQVSTRQYMRTLRLSIVQVKIKRTKAFTHIHTHTKCSRNILKMTWKLPTLAELTSNDACYDIDTSDNRSQHCWHTKWLECVCGTVKLAILKVDSRRILDGFLKSNWILIYRMSSAHFLAHSAKYSHEDFEHFSNVYLITSFAFEKTQHSLWLHHQLVWLHAEERAYVCWLSKPSVAHCFHLLSIICRVNTTQRVRCHSAYFQFISLIRLHCAQPAVRQHYQ